MATTTNYGWTTPDDGDAASLGAAAIRSLGSAVDNRVYLNAQAAIGTAQFPLGTATPTDGSILAFSSAAGLWNPRSFPLGTATPADGDYLVYGTATASWNPTPLDLTPYVTKTSVSGNVISMEFARNQAMVVGENLPIANGETDAEITMAFAGKVLATSIFPQPNHTGTTTVQVLKNGATQGTAYAVTSVAQGKSYTVFGTPVSFAAGDSLGLECTVATTPGDGVSCAMIIRFD